MAVGDATINITANTQQVTEAMTKIGAAWLEAGEHLVDAAEAMLRGARALQEGQTEESDAMWGEAERPDPQVISWPSPYDLPDRDVAPRL